MPIFKKNQNYVLTSTAANDFRNARRWSLSRREKALTGQYFIDLHEGAEQIAKSGLSLPESDSLTGINDLGIYAIREHYMIYVPAEEKKIIVVALIRQSRDVPTILQANGYIIRRELKEILAKTKH